MSKEKFKTKLLEKYKTHLQAWKRLLDPDSDGRVSWLEFESACNEIGLSQIAPQAFLSFDSDLSGFITLQELDQDTYDIVCKFQNWSVQEFGSVYLAFKSMDNDGNKQLSFSEFVNAARDYGFPLQYCKTLFDSLRQPGQHFLCCEDIDFLDRWESTAQLERRTKMLQSISAFGNNNLQNMENADILTPEDFLIQHREKLIWKGLINYNTDTPGPSVYEPYRKFGYGNSLYTKDGEILERANPLLKSSPAYSIRERFPEVFFFKIILEYLILENFVKHNISFQKIFFILIFCHQNSKMKKSKNVCFTAVYRPTRYRTRSGSLPY